jgi:integrase
MSAPTSTVSDLRNLAVAEPRHLPRPYLRSCDSCGHTGISLLSLGGLPIEEVARIAGHSSTRTTEVVYRQELRPVLTMGAETVDRLLGQAASSPPAR